MYITACEIFFYISFQDPRLHFKHQVEFTTIGHTSFQDIITTLSSIFPVPHSMVNVLQRVQNILYLRQSNSSKMVSSELCSMKYTMY
jgi:hypothetical protein